MSETPKDCPECGGIDAFCDFEEREARRNAATLARIKRMLGGRHRKEYSADVRIEAIAVAVAHPEQTSCALCFRRDCEVWGSV